MNGFIYSSDPISDMIESFKNLTFRLSGPTIASLMVMALVAIFAIVSGIQAHFHDPLKPAKGPLFLWEWYYERMEQWAEDTMGKKPGNFTGYFMGLAAYLFLAFIWSITGMPSIIDTLIIPFTLSLVMFVIIQATALKYQHFGYFHRYIEPVVFWFPINLITMWTPIISTTLRMFGNCLAGSVIIGLVNWATKSISASLFTFMGDAGQIVLGPILIGVLNLYFGLFSGFIQTLVFTSLNAVWFSQEMPETDTMGSESQLGRGEPVRE